MQRAILRRQESDDRQESPVIADCDHSQSANQLTTILALPHRNQVTSNNSPRRFLVRKLLKKPWARSQRSPIFSGGFGAWSILSDVCAVAFQRAVGGTLLLLQQLWHRKASGL